MLIRLMSLKKSKFNHKDNYFMKLALNLASDRIGLTGENPSVGCVIVKNNEVISIGQTGINGRPHAEYNAVKSCKKNLAGSKMYVTLEPCSHFGKTPPCTNIIKKKSIKSVYFSQFDPDKRSYKKAKKKFTKQNIKTFDKVYKSFGNNFYKDFFIKKRTEGIFITSKLATSKDLYISNKYNKCY